MLKHPTNASEVRAGLDGFTVAQVHELSRLSGVSAPALFKIKYGTIENPGIETVAKFWPHVKAAKRIKPAKKEPQ